MTKKEKFVVGALGTLAFMSVLPYLIETFDKVREKLSGSVRHRKTGGSTSRQTSLWEGSS